MTNINDLLLHHKKAVRREACWCLSNVAAGTGSQIQKIIDTPQCIKQLIDIVLNDSFEESFSFLILMFLGKERSFMDFFKYDRKGNFTTNPFFVGT